jgi:hypothetical protein
MLNKFLQVMNVLAVLAFGMWVRAVNCIVSNLVIFCDLGTTSFTNNFHEHAIIQLMSSEDQLVISELILAEVIVTLESYLVEILNLKLVQVLKSLQSIISITLAWSVEELGRCTLSPLLVAWLTEVNFTLWALFTLHNDVEAECAAQVAMKVNFIHLGTSLQKSLWVYSMVEIERRMLKDIDFLNC